MTNDIGKSLACFLVEIDECASDPCQHNSTCYDYIGRFSCTCPPGFYGTFCENGEIFHLQKNNGQQTEIDTIIINN